MLKYALLGLLALIIGGSAQADELKLAVGQRGAWDTAIAELGNRAGIFKKHGVELEILYTQGGAETQQAVLSRSVDIGVAVGTLGALGVAARGAPIRIIGGEATRVLITHADVLARKKAAIERFLAAYRETIDWMYAGPEAITMFAQFAGVSEAATKRTRYEFFSKAALDPSTITGLPEMMAEGVQFKFLQAPLTQDQLAQIIQIERKAP